MDCATFARLLDSVQEVDALIRRSRTFLFWRFNTPRMDYTASPDWYAGAV